MRIKTVFIIGLMLMVLPFISANTYGANTYGCGLYGVGCSEEEEVVSEGGGGGGVSKQFDIKILDIESPVILGESFDFMYFVKGVGEFNHDVVIDFWIEKDDVIVTSGSDVVFMGVNEEKTEAASLFLPGDIDSGIYKFVIKVSYGIIQAEAHRTIDIIVTDGEATIGSLFDIRFLLEEAILANSDDLSAIAIFENFGLEPTWVNLTFIILNEEGRQVYIEKDGILVETENILRKSFKELGLDDGKYTLILETLYGDNVMDEFRHEFEIVGEERVINWILYLIGFVVLVLLIWIIILIVRHRERKKCEKITKKIKYYDKETGKPPQGKVYKKKKKKKVEKPHKSIHQKIRKEVGNL